MKRAGGWLLGVIVVLAMGVAGWFLLRRVLQREPALIYLLDSDREPTTKAMRRGAEAALQELGSRAGHFKISLVPGDPDLNAPMPALLLGTSGAVLRLGDQQPPPFVVTVIDTHPAEPAGWLRITPGCTQQGVAAARWMSSSKLSRIFVLKDPLSRRSMTIGEAFERTAKELGLEIIGPVDPTQEWNGLIERIIGSRADAVFFSGEEVPYLTAYKVFHPLREKGFAGTLAQAEADPEVSFLATRPTLVEGSCLVSPFAPGPQGGPHVNAGYFAMKAMLDAIDHANSVEPEALRRAAAKLPYFDAQGRAALRKCALYVAKNGVFEFVGLLD